MTFLQAVILGIVQGLTEFLPVSSSGHLLISTALMHIKDPGAGFTAVIQLGTLAATFVYFWKDIASAFTAWVKSISDKELRKTPEARIGWATFWGTIPIAVIGLTLEKKISEDARNNLYLTAGMLIVFGLILLIAEFVGKKTRPIEDTQIKDGLIMGAWQACALIPGASRSGSSISGGLFLGLERGAAARLSFLLSVPAVAISGFYELFKARHELFEMGPAATIIATIVSFGVGMAAISFLISYLKTKPVTIFVVYRVVVGIVLIALIKQGVIDANPTKGADGSAKPSVTKGASVPAVPASQ